MEKKTTYEGIELLVVTFHSAYYIILYIYISQNIKII